MIHKTIIVVLTLAAVSVTAMSVISYGTPLRSEEFWLGDRDILLFSCDAGHAKLSWVRAEEGIKSLRIRHNSNVEFAIIYGGYRALRKLPLRASLQV